MQTDEDGKRRLDSVNDILAHHIVGTVAQVDEEEEGKNRRLDWSQPHNMTEDFQSYLPCRLPTYRRLDPIYPNILCLQCHFV